MKLEQAGQVTLDGSGNGTIPFQCPPWQRWRIEHVSVSTSQASGTTPVPTAATYRNVISPQHFEGGTRDGDLDTGTGLIIAEPSDTIYVVFTGGIAASTAYATLRGTYDTS